MCLLFEAGSGLTPMTLASTPAYFMWWKKSSQQQQGLFKSQRRRGLHRRLQRQWVIHYLLRDVRQFQKNVCVCFTDYAKKPLSLCIHGAQLIQSCPTFCNPMDCIPPGSSVRGIFQARILEWVAISSSRGIFLIQGSNPCLLRLLCWRWHLYLLSYRKPSDHVDHNKLWKMLKEMRVPDHLTCLLRNLYASQEATVRIGHGTKDWFII